MKEKIEVHLHTNDSCNLKCNHCYNKSGKEGGYNLPDTDCLLELIQYFCTEYEAEIHLEGGEIFLRTELLRKMNRLPLKMLQCITVTTNGTICIDESEIVDMLCKLHALRISVEGHTDEQQRNIRGISLKEVVECALFYKEKDVPVWLRLTLTKQNYEHLLDGTLPCYIDKGFQNFQVYEFQSVGRGESNKNLFMVDDAAFDRFLHNMAEQKGFQPEGELKFMFPEKRREAVRFYEEVLRLNGLKIIDMKPENGVSIHADGSLYLCAWDSDESHCIMNVYKSGIEYMDEKLRQISLRHECNHCSAIGIVC